MAGFARVTIAALMLVLSGSVSTTALIQSASAQSGDAPLPSARDKALPILEDRAAQAAAASEQAAEIAAKAEAAARAAAKKAAALKATGDKVAAAEATRFAKKQAAAAKAARAKAKEAARVATAARAAVNEPRAAKTAEDKADRAAEKADAKAVKKARAAEEAAARAVAKARAEKAAARAASEEAARDAEKAAAQATARAENAAARAARQEAARDAEKAAAQATARAENAAARAAREEAARDAEKAAARVAQKAESELAAKEQAADTAREERRRDRELRLKDRERSTETADNAKQKALEARRAERRREREERRTKAAASAPRIIEPSDSAVEQQIVIQRGEEQLRELRRLREKLKRERELVEDQQDEAASRANSRERERLREERRESRAEDNNGDGDKTASVRYRDREDGRGDRGELIQRLGDRIVIRLGDQLIIQPEREGDRLLSRARDVKVEDLGNGDTRTTVFRENGVRVVTERDRFGDILARIRILPNGEEIVLIDNVRVEQGTVRRDNYPRVYAQIEELPPLVVRIPEEEYIVETRAASRQEVREAFIAPAVELVERDYTLDEVRYSERLRDKVRRVDLDTITFDFGSAAVSLDQLNALDNVGLALEEVIAQRPDEVFLIEGHTDAVGSDEANLLLSDRRAEAVAVALSEDFDIPPENLVTQGYGEEQLKVATADPERENRRVAIRRITPLLRAESQE
jgi:outer membrane protein OmpA-like peptidoglycan-associated protein